MPTTTGSRFQVCSAQSIKFKGQILFQASNWGSHCGQAGGGGCKEEEKGRCIEENHFSAEIPSRLICIIKTKISPPSVVMIGRLEKQERLGRILISFVLVEDTDNGENSDSLFLGGSGEGGP